MKISFGLLIGFQLLLTGCTRKVTSEELEHYLAEPSNGLTHVKEIGDLTIQVAYRPISIATINTSTSGVSQCSQYYLLSISREGNEALDPTRGFAAYSSLLQTLAFRPQEYMQLITSSGDTLLPHNAILERTYGLSTSTRVLVAFPSKENMREARLHIGEFGLGLGNLIFSFKQRDISALPKATPAVNSTYSFE